MDLKGRIQRLEERVRELEHAESHRWQATLERMSVEELEALARGGPGEVNVTALTTEQLVRLQAGERLEVVVPNWRELVNR